MVTSPARELQRSGVNLQAEYNDDTAVIPKSSSVLVRRVPNLPPAQLTYQQPATNALASTAVPASNGPPANPPGPSGNGGGEDEFGGDLYSEQRDEDSALTELLNQTGKNWQVLLFLPVLSESLSSSWTSSVDHLLSCCQAADA